MEDIERRQAEGPGEDVERRPTGPEAGGERGQAGPGEDGVGGKTGPGGRQGQKVERRGKEG